MAKNRKMTTCRFCGAEIAASAKTCPHCGGKNKKPFYKKWWFWVIAVIFVAAVLPRGGKKAEKAETAVKPTAAVTETVTATPTPTAEPLPVREEMNGFDKETNQTLEYGGVIFQLPSYLTRDESEEGSNGKLRYAYEDGQNAYVLTFEIADTTGEKFISSRDAVQEKLVKNSKNGKLISSSDQNIEGMTSRIFEFTCGDNNEVLSKILLIYNYDTAKAICVTTGERLTAPKSFGSDTTKIFYTLKKVVPEKEPVEGEAAVENQPVENTAPAEEPAESTAEETGGVSPEFKKTMDDYEAFFNEYAEFMKKYANSDDAMSMLNDYLSMLTKYSEAMEGLDSINEQELSTADYAYYTEVMLKIDAKLIEAAQAMQ